MRVTKYPDISDRKKFSITKVSFYCRIAASLASLKVHPVGNGHEGVGTSALSSELSGAYWEISGEYYVTKYPDPDVTRECKIFSNRCKWTQKQGIPGSFCGLGREQKFSSEGISFS